VANLCAVPQNTVRNKQVYVYPFLKLDFPANNNPLLNKPLKESVLQASVTRQCTNTTTPLLK